MTKLITASFNSHLLNQLAESIYETANNSYYLYVAEHVERTSNTIPTPVNKVKTTYVDVYRDMLFGKRLGVTNFTKIVDNNPWASGTTFDMYDDDDDDLFDDLNFYTVVDETGFLHVYKCLDNNMNAESTSQPTFSHVTGSNSTLYQTSDGYRWKYMYSFSDTQDDQFSTQAFIPVIANTTVTGLATAGSIDIVKIEDGGKNYNNYLTGTFSGAELRISGNSILYEVSNATASTVNGYYTDCIIYLSSGTGVGQYKTVDSYFVNSTGSYLTVNNAFTTAPLNGTTYEINPRLLITGDGQETNVAVGRALINSLSTNSIYRIEMLNHGANYKYHTATVSANAVVGVTATANVRPIYSPINGHGHDAAEELGAKRMCIGVTLANTESDTIPALNTYQKIGIMKDPVFSNVVFSYYNANGSFVNGEMVHKIKPIRVDENATLNTSSNAISSNTGDYANQFSVGDFVYLKSSNSVSHMVASISTITNATHMTLSSNGKFACTTTSVYLANVTSNAVVNNTINATHMVFDDISSVFGNGDEYIGVNSGARAMVNSVFRNGVEKGFDTFVQMYKYTGTMTSGTFSLDEAVFQGVDLDSSTANAYLHSANISGGITTIYTTNQIGIFANAGTMEGNSSGATATINQSYSPELKHGSGDIISMENVQTIPRVNTASEAFKIVLELDLNE